MPQSLLDEDLLAVHHCCSQDRVARMVIVKDAQIEYWQISDQHVVFLENYCCKRLTNK